MKRSLPWLLLLLTLVPLSAEAHPYVRNPTIDWVDDRPFVLHFPPDSAESPAMRPLVILLPGYQTSATMEEAYLQLRVKTDAARIVFAALEGSHDQLNNQFWNGGACCQLFVSSVDWWVDDVGYLDRVITAIVNEVASTQSKSGSWSIDPDRIFVIGHSSGAFLAHRYACSSTGGQNGASRVAAIVALSGTLNFYSPESGSTPALSGLCSPTAWVDGPTPENRRVSVLQIHATNDHLIEYGGSFMFNGAETTFRLWEQRNGCTEMQWKQWSSSVDFPYGPAFDDKLDFLEDSIWGGGTTYRYPTPFSSEIGSKETWIFRSTCAPVELWRIIGPGLATGDLSGHIPTFHPTGQTFAEKTINWLMAHPKTFH